MIGDELTPEALIAVGLPPELLQDPSEDFLERELAVTQAAQQRERWRKDPVAWATEKLGEKLWSGQVKILRAFAEHRKLAIATCHGVGKSYSASLIAAYWIDIHEPGQAFVVTTAPTSNQVKGILWKEIGRAHTRGDLIGRINPGACEWKANVGSKEETLAMGRKPSDYAPDAFQGFHAPFVLVIVDEANGVRGPLHDALDSLTSNDDCKKVMIGNPDDPRGEFCDACKPGSGYHVIHVDAFSTPNFTGEPIDPQIAKQLIGRIYVEERRVKWAPRWTWSADGSRCVPPAGSKLEDTHPFWQSKVLGQFPVQSSAGSLIPLTWIREAQARELPPVGDNELGLDVGASVNGDPSCLGHRRGPVFRVLWEQREPDTMKTAGRLGMALADKSINATRAKVDYIGVGRGVVDKLREDKLKVVPVSVGEAGSVLICLTCKHEWDTDLVAADHCPNCNGDQHRKVFADKLSQLWWQVRERFERGDIDIDPDDEQLAEELLQLRWEPTSKSQIKVKYDDGPSPNRADALLFTFARVDEGLLTPAEAGLSSYVTW